MKFSRKTFSLAALVATFLAATFAAGAPVVARPVVSQPPVIEASVNSQNEGEWPTPTLISSGDVAPSSWAITQNLDAWAALSGVGFPMAGVLQRMATPDVLERDEHNMAVRHVTSASQSPTVRETVGQDASSADSEPSARAAVAPEGNAEGSAASSPSAVPPSPNSSASASPVAAAPVAASPAAASPAAQNADVQNADSSAVASATSPAVAAPSVAPSVASAPAKPSSATPATSTRKAPVSVGGTRHRPSAVGPDATAPGQVVMPKASVVSPGSKKIGATKVPLVKAAPLKAAPRRDPARLSARRKDRILLARLEADLMRANRGLDRANDTLSKGQKQLMQMGSTLRTAMLEAGPEARGLHPFVRVAMRYAGTPYVWGGESRNGFDCSGFIIVVMRDLGYHALPHSAAEQFNYGTPIAQELLKPGDIVFFKNTYKPGVSHVGIYLGNRRFINAAGTGKGTIVSSLDDPHWQAHYAGARRLIRS